RALQRARLQWLSSSIGSVESLQPVNTTPPDLRDEMCGPHRKRPAAEEADDDTSGSFMLSSLPPSSGKASQLVKDKPAAVKTIAVYLGPAKKSAETQFADARQKLSKQGKGKAQAALSRDPHTAPVADQPAHGTAGAVA